jgi:hypothetical protein
MLPWCADGVSRGVSTLQQGTMPVLGADVQDLTIETIRISPDILEVKIGASSPRWEVPNGLFERTAFAGDHSRDVAFCLA